MTVYKMGKVTMKKFVALGACVLGLTVAMPVMAIETAKTPEMELRGYAATLSENLRTEQLDNLWRQVNRLGYFNGSNTNKVMFTLDQAGVEAKIKETLADPTAVMPYKATEAIYRKDFGDTVGKKGETKLTSVCIQVDWRTVRAGVPTDDVRAVASAGLLQAYPCAEDGKP